MSILGFTAVSCDGPTCDYGCPYAKFKVKGVVTDEENHPVENIQVVVNHYDTIYTNAEGKYATLPQMIYPWDSVQLVATDIDGIENGGEYETSEQRIGFSSDEFKDGDGEWYEGQAIKEVNFKLMKKTNN